MSTQFGRLIKDLRIAKGLTLRQCCEQLRFDPSNWSKIERGINPAPKDQKLLTEWAEYLGQQGEALIEFLDLAAISRNEIPADLGSDARIIEALPVFFRAARGVEMDDAKFAQFIDQVRKLHTTDA